MKVVKTVLLIYLVVLFSAAFLYRFSIYSTLPNIVLTLALLFLFQNEFKKGLLWVIIGGLFIDFFSVGFPSNTLISVGLYLLIWLLIKKFFEVSNLYIFLIFCFVGNMIYDLMFFIFFHIRDFPIQIIIKALYSTALGLMLYLIFAFSQKRHRKKMGLMYMESK